MKYISVLMMVLFMAWTWSMANHSSTMNLQQHREVEQSFEQFIRASIQEKNPNVKDVIFRQLFTETIKEGEQVRARFRYDVVSPTSAQDTTSQTIEGSALLKSTDHGATWAMSDVELTSPSIRYENGSQISTKNLDPNAEPPHAPPSKTEAAPDTSVNSKVDSGQ